MDLHLFASPKSASHHIGLIRRDNKEAKKVNLYSRRRWKEQGRQGRGRWRALANMQEVMFPQERD